MRGGVEETKQKLQRCRKRLDAALRRGDLVAAEAHGRSYEALCVDFEKSLKEATRHASRDDFTDLDFLVLRELDRIYAECLRECERHSPEAAEEFRETLQAIGDALRFGAPTSEDIASLVRLREALRYARVS